MNNNGTMQAMLLQKAGQPLVLKTVPVPMPNNLQVLIKIIACGVCRTDLHIVDGDLQLLQLPIIPGHEIVGEVVQTGRDVTTLKQGDKVGVPWLAFTCGECKFCRMGKENLCDKPLFTGYTINGGFAEYTVAYAKYCFPLPSAYANASGSPLLCAGLIGYRSYTMIGEGITTLGIYGFGAAAHILIQVALQQGKKVFAFTQEGDEQAQLFARRLGATWAGNSNQTPPEILHAAIIFAPVGHLVIHALRNVDKGGVVVCAGIHMSDIPSFQYKLLWEERVLRSVANLTRKDGEAFLQLAPQVPVKTETKPYPLHQANEALDDLRSGKLSGAAVLVMS
jgi:propanol-preferring alcohol dehydrogenase